jgi:hypothetical protein
VLAIVEDIVENTGNPDKIRSLMQDLGRHHYRRVRSDRGVTSGVNVTYVHMLPVFANFGPIS